MIDSTVLPDLRMLPTQALVPHEDCDPRRVEKLCLRVRQEQRLKNPPVVAPIPGTDRFVILDGANRALTFVALDIPHIVAQVVHYGEPGLILDTWYHVVAGMELDEFEQRLTQVTGLSLVPCRLEEAREALAMNGAAAYIVCASGVRMVCNSHDHPLRDIRLLVDIVEVYRGRANIYRASNDIWEKQKPYYADITALVIFPRLAPADILAAARNGEKVPSGITRHVIPNRAVHINIPLEILESDQTQAEKETWLKEWLMERMGANAIRYYAESTFSFDE
jgi:hypothetical protein